MDIIIQWVQYNVAESFAIAISLLSVALTMILSQREKPNIMPSSCAISNETHLSLDFLNTSQFNIHKLTILINGFDSNLNELTALHFLDKYLFSVGEKTSFNYGFNLGDYRLQNFYFRVRFRGQYKTRIPFVSRTVEQSLWYSAIILGQAVGTPGAFAVKISNTHKNEIEMILARHSVALSNYEKVIDKKFN